MVERDVREPNNQQPCGCGNGEEGGAATPHERGHGGTSKCFLTCVGQGVLESNLLLHAVPALVVVAAA